MVQKPSTINTAGLQFVSAPAQPTNTTMNVIHGGRKTNPIIETFKCEVCNQVKFIRMKNTGLFERQELTFYELLSTMRRVTIVIVSKVVITFYWSKAYF